MFLSLADIGPFTGTFSDEEHFATACTTAKILTKSVQVGTNSLNNNSQKSSDTAIPGKQCMQSSNTTSLPRLVEIKRVGRLFPVIQCGVTALSQVAIHRAPIYKSIIRSHLACSV